MRLKISDLPPAAVRRRLSRRPPPSPFPFTLHRKRIYVLPTRYGLLFIGVLSAMLLGSLNYNNNLGFLLTFLLGSMALLSALYTVRNLNGVTLVSARAKPVFAGERALFEIRIRTPAPQRPGVRISLEAGEEIRVDLPGDAALPAAVPVVPRRRGLFDPGTLTIRTHFPLGLFRAWSRLSLDLTCLVYPKPITGPFTAKRSGDDPSGTDDGSRGPEPEDFQDLSPYRPGDPLGHIYWKAFSRGQGLVTKTFSGLSGGGSVLLDWEAAGPGDAETRLSRLCGLVLSAHRSGIPYGLSLPGVEVAPGTGEAHRHRCLKRLALHGGKGKTP